MEEQTAEVRRVQEECDKRQRVEDAYLALMDDEGKYLKDRFDRLVERNREDGRDKPEELIRADRHPQPATYIVRNQGHDGAIRKVDAQEPRLKESLFKDVAPNSTRTTKSEQVCCLTVLPARQPDRRGHKGEHIDRRGRLGHPQGTCGDTREGQVPRHRDGRRNRGGGGGLRPYAHVRAKECHPSRRFRDRAANKERNVRQLQLQCGPAKPRSRAVLNRITAVADKSAHEAPTSSFYDYYGEQQKYTQWMLNQDIKSKVIQLMVVQIPVTP